MQKGSIFCTVRNNQKRFFQYVGSDLSQLNSDVIGIFRRNYTHNEFPNVARFLDDTYEYVLHTTISLGKRMCGWEYLGETSEPHKIDDVLFVTQHSHPLFYRVGEPIDGGWRIWKMNEDAAVISYHPNGKLTNGMVFPPYSIEELLFDTGFDEFYDIHATGERKKSVWFQQQKWDDTIEREFINKLNLTHHELSPESILSQADILMQSDNEINRDAGVRLLHIVIEKYKTMPLAYTRA